MQPLAPSDKHLESFSLDWRNYVSRGHLCPPKGNAGAGRPTKQCAKHEEEEKQQRVVFGYTKHIQVNMAGKSY